MNDKVQDMTIPEDGTPAMLLKLAIQQPNFDVEKLGKLMELQERWEARQAKIAYDRAITDFQSKCPVLKRTKKVAYNQVSYSYAPLSEIKETINDTMKFCGLSYRWEFKDGGKDDPISVTCIITHESGHSERTTMSAWPDDSGAKNEIQQRGSTLTYMQRYTLIGALGITSADTDDDGKASGALNIEKIRAHNNALRDHFHSIYIVKQSIADENLSAAAEALGELDRATIDVLFLAPTKGGIFTTHERSV